MRKVLSRNLDSTLILIAGYFLLAFVVRILRSSALEIDETQQALLSQHLLLGYGSQPFLYTWLQHGVNGLLGPSIASLSLLKNGLLSSVACSLANGQAVAARQDSGQHCDAWRTDNADSLCHGAAGFDPYGSGAGVRRLVCLRAFRNAQDT